jgi:hypothetical protein
VIAHNSVKVVVAHNHPSGNKEPSEEDLMMTARIGMILHALDVELIDSLVVAGEEVISIKKHLLAVALAKKATPDQVRQLLRSTGAEGKKLIQAILSSSDDDSESESTPAGATKH